MRMGAFMPFLLTSYVILIQISMHTNTFQISRICLLWNPDANLDIIAEVWQALK